ncbi:hypothetical protein N7470_004318 [Penicillium chermesinum]|nr:hypothetical protein N7470_004318 [Penicillium chermesinum]
MAGKGDLWTELEKRYCPPLDPALFAAIFSDYDIESPDQVKELRQNLDTLQELAVQQEFLPFDPSGTANDTEHDVVDLGGAFSEPAMTAQTDQTSMVSSLLSDDSIYKGKRSVRYTLAADGSRELTGATPHKSVNNLLEMFPSLSRIDIELELKKNNGDVTKSMDVLLNQAFFDETKDAPEDIRINVPKGIDGFVTEDNVASRQSERKKKNKKYQKLDIKRGRSSDCAPVNKWETGQADIDFICSRALNASKTHVTSLYYAHSASLSSTIRAIALTKAPKTMAEVDGESIIMTQIPELRAQFPSVEPTTLVGLLRLTRHMMSATQELAEAMVKATEVSAEDFVKLSMAPLSLENPEDVTDAKGHRRGAPSISYGFEEAKSRAESKFSAGRAAREQASQAARRARSNPLYGGAAAVYHERSREMREMAFQELAVASDWLVDQQSSSGDLDLHGVTVANGVRIARERVEAWWKGLGDAKHIRGRAHGGYKIITGVGIHSPDGTSRLGPAVSRMLVEEGWKVEINRGYLIVTGKARR